LRDFGVVQGPEKSTVADLTFKHLDLKLKNPAVSVRGVKNVKFEDVKLNGAAYQPVEK
jgi:hypothetical protein